MFDPTYDHAPLRGCDGVLRWYRVRKDVKPQVSLDGGTTWADIEESKMPFAIIRPYSRNAVISDNYEGFDDLFERTDLSPSD